jgi:hypothetical protein
MSEVNCGIKSHEELIGARDAWLDRIKTAGMPSKLGRDRRAGER